MIIIKIKGKRKGNDTLAEETMRSVNFFYGNLVANHSLEC